MSYVMTVPLTTASGVRDVYIAEGRYALVTTFNGVEVVDLLEGRIISSGTLPSPPLCVAADWQSLFGKMYIGTSTSGVFDMNYVLAREVDSDFTESLVQRYTTSTLPPLSANQINDLDALPGRLLIGTSAGVDFVGNGTDYASRALVSGSRSVRLTQSGGGYWITNSGTFEGAVEVNYDLFATTGTNIIGVDFEYTTTSTPALPAVPPFDVTVSEIEGHLPVIAAATASGAFVFEEMQGNEFLAQNKVLGNEFFVSADFGSTAHFNGGFFNATTTGILRVFDLSSNSVVGNHAPDFGTRGQSVVTGTITIVRASGPGVRPL